jgi:hypothetical protein
MIATARGGLANAICAAAKATIEAIASVGIALISAFDKVGAEGGAAAGATSTPIAAPGFDSGAIEGESELLAAPVKTG